MMKFLLTGLLLISASAQGADFQAQCPVRYPMRDIVLSEVPQGWNGSASVRKGAVLVGAGLYEGTEEIPAELVGSGQIKTKDGVETRYAVDVGPKRLACAYGGGVELLHHLPVTATICVIKTKKQKSRQDDLDIRIVCK